MPDLPNRTYIEIVDTDELEALSQAVFDKHDELVTVLGTADDKKFMAELVTDIQALQRLKDRIAKLES